MTKIFQSRWNRFTVFFILLLLHHSAEAQVRKRIDNSSIKPVIIAGESGGQLNIGDTTNRIFQLYPKLKRSSYTPTSGCDFSNLELPDSMVLTIKDNRIVQITVKNNYPKTTPETIEKIKPGSFAALVRKAYPNANKSFTKLSETFTATGYEPLIYWVDKSDGIAFEFYTDSSRGRLVNAIHVFAPNSQFLFNDGCDKNEDLRELPAFATKVPEKIIRDYQP